MFRELVSQARSGVLPASGSVQQELEAVTAERDFFREKYTEQIDAMETLQGQLKESQRMIEKLRSQIIDLELERARLAGEEGVNFSPVKVIKSPKKSEGGSTNTSITSGITSCEDSTRSTPTNVENEARSDNATGIHENNADKINASIINSDSTEDILCCDEEKEDLPRKNDFQAADEDEVAEEDHSTDDDSEEGDASDEEKDEADQIRAKAERMLIWANYQTARRTTPIKESNNNNNNGYDTNEDNLDGDSVTHSEVTSPRATRKCSISNIPASLNNTKSLLDDNSSLGSVSRNKSVASWRSGGNNNVSGGESGSKLGKLFSNIKDIIDPPSDSDSEDDDSESCSVDE